MTTDELRKHLTYLTEKYVHDDTTKQSILALIARDNVPAKGILAKLTPLFSDKLSDDEKDVIKDIAYWFC